MKKKIATFLMLLMVCLSVFTGCNLFGSSSYKNLNSVVATSGDIKITREELITSYNNGGYNYNYYYGYTVEEALKRTIDELIQSKYLLNYIEELEKTDSRYTLNDRERYKVITETWEYIDSAIESVVKSVRKDLKLSTEDLSTEEEESSDSDKEYSPKEAYTSKFTFDTSTGHVVRIDEDEENTFVPTNKTQYDYELKLNSKNKDYETLVWNRYISSLKNSQRSYNYTDTSDKATFNREIDRVYKINLNNAKLQKFQDLYTNNFGLSYDSDNEYYYVNDKTLGDIITKYTTTYNSNKELYDMYNSYQNIANFEKDLTKYYSLVTNTSNRKNYVYYGSPSDDEKLLTCMHILIKFTETQTNNISNYKDDVLIQDYLDEVLAYEKSANNTYGFERDLETAEVIDENNPISVTEIYQELLDKFSTIPVHYSNSTYVEDAVDIFDEFIYKYNQDTGIINAQFDYVVGTTTSPMVTSFTEVVRRLYNNGVADYSLTNATADYDENVTLYFPYGVGYAGAISAPFLEESDNYSGYHIVIFTGVLKNTVADTLTINNVYSKLGNIKTSLAYNETLFELMYDDVATSDYYSTYQTNLVDSLSRGKTTQYVKENFSDLY